MYEVVKRVCLEFWRWVDILGIKRREILVFKEVICTKTDQKGDEDKRCSTMKEGPWNKEKEESHKLKQ